MKALEMPTIERLLPVWTAKNTNICLSSGRGLGKTEFAGDWLIAKAMSLPRAKLLVIREFQNSIRDSNLETLVDKIYHFGMMTPTKLWDIGKTELTYLPTGSRINFLGINTNPESLKSRKGILGVHIEEAQTISVNAIRQLLPTIERNPGIQILWTGNPRFISDPWYQAFLAKDELIDPDFQYDLRDGSLIIEMDIDDNDVSRGGWMSRETHKEWYKSRDALKESDYEEWEHVYCGKLWIRNDALVFRPHTASKGGHWRADEYVKGKPKTDENLYWWSRKPYHAEVFLGSDYGDKHATTLIETWLWEDEEHGRIMYIKDEKFKKEATPDEHAELWMENDLAREGHQITVDPGGGGSGFIRQMEDQHGFNCIAAEKGKDSVMHNVWFVKNHKLIIHPSCKHLLGEIREWSYKVDPQTERVLRKIEDKQDDDTIFGMLYSIEQERKRQEEDGTGWMPSLI